MRVWWVSCTRFTIRVSTINGIIKEAAPIARKFIGQDFRNLLKWASGFGGLQYQDLDDNDLF